MAQDFHFLLQRLWLFASSEHHPLSAALERKIAEFVKFTVGNQAGLIVETHSHRSVAQHVEHAVFWLLLEEADEQ